jgi:predicted transcriptional regulator
MVAELKRFRDVAVLVVTPLADVEAEIDFAADIGVNRSGVLSTTMSELRLRYVPGVVVADAEGRVLFAKEGLLTEEDRLHVIRIASQ